MFRDECELVAEAGKGGDGLVSFRREKYVHKGGPNGGDGGDGGSVILVATSKTSSLLEIGRKPRYRAEKGQPGGPVNRAGRGGRDCVVPVPVGTQIFDQRRGHLLRDLKLEGESVVLCRGGRGGRGNASFANAVRQTPRHAEPGRPGEARSVRLELKLVAQVGLVGLPNAGKSTFLSTVSRATPKIADYPFTTLAPQVAVAEVGHLRTLVLADLPGLIEGAAEGVGLGHRFLKHVERCSVLLHLVDVSGSSDTEPVDAAQVLQGELERYSPELATRPRLLVATKCESPEAEERAAALAEVMGPTLRMSSATGQGVPEVLEAAWGLVHPGETID